MPCCNLAVPAGVSATQEHNRPASRCRTRKGNIRIKLMRMECAWVCVGATARAGGVKQAQRGRRPSHETPRASRPPGQGNTRKDSPAMRMLARAWWCVLGECRSQLQHTQRSQHQEEHGGAVGRATRCPRWGSGGGKFTLGGEGSAWLAFYKAEAAWSCEKEARSKADAPSTP